MAECENCTACCYTTRVDAVDSLNGVYCKQCDQGVGCSIYSERPILCTTYECSYYQMDKVHPALRPDKCGFVFERISETVMLATALGEMDPLPPLIRGQVESFIDQGVSVFIQQFNPYKSMCMYVAGVDLQDILETLDDKSWEQRLAKPN